ncbi:MAG: TetR/AcrR family transcriptional regulator [Parvibaculum sp.]|nr:TetR/AcrR family transcriptional regulator [Parvibaculum sp.]MDP3328039.1 TetR/AcrR family transcriptional regulator [Parvibaculum sp.]
MKAARKNFLSGGYSRAAMAEIAKDADVSTATLYKHFTSKDELFAAVVHEACTRTETVLQTDISGKSASAVLRHICNAYVRQQFDEEMNEFLRMVIAEVPSVPHLALEVYNKGILGYYNDFRKVMDGLVARGDLKPHDTEAGVRYLGGMVKEFVVWPALFTQNLGKPEDLEAKLGACIDAYLQMYRS